MASKYRFAIRRVRDDDLQGILDAALESADEVYPWMPWCHPELSLQEVTSWYNSLQTRWEQDEGYNFVIIERLSNLVVGGIGLNYINRNYRMANMVYWVRTGFIGYGAASNAIQQLAAYAFSLLELQRLEIVTPVGNVPSQKAALNAGAKLEGQLRKRIWLHGKPHDAYMYSLIEEDLSGPG